MPFGVKNAPAKFQRVMDETLQGLEFVRCYIDDILIFSITLDDHLGYLQQLFDWLRQAGLKCHPGKCVVAVLEVLYLGHLIKPGTMEPQDSKVQAVRGIPVPEDVSELRQFLGLASYYRRFIPSFSEIANPLNSLLKKEKTWE